MVLIYITTKGMGDRVFLSVHRMKTNSMMSCWKLHDSCTVLAMIMRYYIGFRSKEGDPNIFTDPTLKQFSVKYGKTPAQIALRFLTQQGMAVVPKSNDKHRQQENINVSCSEQWMMLLG